MTVDVKQIGEKVQKQSQVIGRIRTEFHRVIVGQDQLIDRLLVALFSNNHVLIEGVPGLAKTLTVTTLAKMLQATFQRIQFTPDLLPADVIGTQNEASLRGRVMKRTVGASVDWTSKK